MKSEEYDRLVRCMNALLPDDDAAVLLTKRGDDINAATFGEPRQLWKLKEWAFKWLGGREERRKR